MTNITLLGSTGSIGTSTLDVVRQRPNEFSIFSLVAGRNIDLLCSQILEFRPKLVVVADTESIDSLAKLLLDSNLPKSAWPELLFGAAGRVRAAAAPEVHFVMSAIVGVAGLQATYEAIRAGKRIGLANKEVLVASGRLVMAAAKARGVDLLPVDSEHNGAHQCFRGGKREEVTRLLLTASGGPFRDMPADRLWSVTPEQALNHPTWKMGQRITIDSATMMNKGFEVIEACWLFDLSPEQVEVVVHPQSSIHAMVEYSDGSVIAQASATDMRMPIQYALTYPRRESAPVPRLDWTTPRTWNFFPPDLAKFPLLELSYAALERGGSATCTLNAADEIAVGAFLEGKIPFPAIAQTIEETLSRQSVREPETIEEVIEIDEASRETARRVLGGVRWTGSAVRG
ncbi:MAG: 1-deoxy-D-xylulose-5-phosphate reductoisomerase [Bryobacteraceae bacterium]